MFWTKAKLTVLPATVIATAVVGGSVSGIQAEDRLEDGAKKADLEQVARINDLIEKLASEDYQERQTASREIRTLGEAAIPMLKDALGRTKDPEQRNRCRQLVNGIITTEDRRKMEEVVYSFLDRYAEDQREKMKEMLAPGATWEGRRPLMESVHPVGDKNQFREGIKILKGRYCRWREAPAEWQRLLSTPRGEDVLIVLTEEARSTGTERFRGLYFVVRRHGETWQILDAGDCRIPVSMRPKNRLP